MVDKKDLLIIEALKKNARASVAQISKETGLAGTTVHNRIKKLRQNGIITGYTIKVDNKKLGKDIAAYALLTVDYNIIKQLKTSQHNVAKELKNLSQVEEASMVTGEADIILKLRARNIEELNHFITVKLRNTDGIEKTKTVVILDEVLD